MSKATFYEHFANKEECIVALFDAAVETLLHNMREAVARHADADPTTRVRTTLEAFLGTLARYREESQTLLVEIVGAGPRAMERRDRALDAVATYIDELNRVDAERGRSPRLPSFHDAYAITGAVVELASRQIRTGVPGDIRDLEPVVERLILGLLASGSSRERPRGARERDRRLPPLPAPGRVARAGRAREAGRVPRLGLLGPPGAGLRRSGRARAAARAGARRPRREPHRPHVHRRPVGRLPVRRAARHRVRQPADGGVARRRARAARLLHHRGRALRAAGQQAAAVRARQLPRLARPRARPADRGARGRLPRQVRLGRDRAAAAAEVRARRRGGRRAGSRCSAAFTPASRTRSPASSPRR